ncbi:MAG: hypothetical protein DRJ03_17155 [Chloroflexi bacterium]|nr:MAG: hypothetical protein DRJ03_17155 [Chloroflexota bacterium]
MHMLLRIVIRGKSEEEALTRTRIICEKLLEKGKLDFYTLFDEDKPLAGKNRWGNLPPAVPYKTRLGKKLIKDGLKATWKEFHRGYKELKRILKQYTARELFEGKVLTQKNLARQVIYKIANKTVEEDFYMLDYYLDQIKRDIPFGWIIGEDGYPLRCQRELEFLMEVYKLSKGEKWWVVPVDIHY